MTTRTLYARIGLSLALGLLVFASGLQVAQAAPKRLGVVTFRGPGEGATRNAVTRVGKSNRYQIVGGQQISKAASKLKVTLDTNDSFLAVARELGISAFVTGEVSKKKATLTVRNGIDGSVTAEASWTGPNPRKLSAAVGKTFWKRLGGAIDRSKAPSGAKQAVVAEEAEAPEPAGDDGGDDEEKSSSSKKVAAASDESSGSNSRKSSKKKTTETESDSETTVSAKSEPEEESSGSAMEALILSVGPRFVNRSLGYTDNINNSVGNYNLAAGPQLALNADLFPLAFSQGGFLSNIGLTASVGYMLPVVTATSAAVPGRSYKTFAMDWSVGLKVRFPIGAYGTVAFGDSRWQLVRPAGITQDITPMVDYRFIRIGTGGRIRINDSLTVMANLAYLHVLSFGEIASRNYFPRTKGMGVEVGAAIGYRVTPLIEIQAGADFRQFGLAFNVSKSEYDASVAAGTPIKVAGGAADRYIMGFVAVAVTLGGSGAASGGASEETASAKSDDEDEEKKDEDKDEDEDEKKDKDK